MVKNTPQTAISLQTGAAWRVQPDTQQLEQTG